MTLRGNGRESLDPVAYEDRCPGCGERECDSLVWIDEGERVRCQSCGTVYRPPGLGGDREQSGGPSEGRDGA